MDDAASAVKRRKLENDYDYFQYFFNEYERYDEFMLAFKDVLSSPEQCLLPTVIEDCDATTSRSFNECRCVATADTDRPFHFGAFFLHGVEIYNSFYDKQVPDGTVPRKLSAKLLEYLFQSECHEEMHNVGNTANTVEESRIQVMVTLAEHYFSKLSYSPKYIVDQSASKSEICGCGRLRKDNLQFDDTSIGNTTVWHGCLDILFDRCDVSINIPEGETLVDEDDDNDDSPWDPSGGKDVDSVKHRSQILAQTIVFSMLQKQRHPEADNFLIPSATANSNSVKFYFYDGKNDIILESKRYSFYWPSTTSKLPGSIVFETLIASWLVMNYKFLASGPYKECISNAPKSKFRHFAKESLQIYEDGLEFQNVKRQPQLRTFSQWERFRYLKSFEWPSSLAIKPK